MFAGNHAGILVNQLIFWNESARVVVGKGLIAHQLPLSSLHIRRPRPQISHPAPQV